MPTYRIYYVERELKQQDASMPLQQAYGRLVGPGVDPEHVSETEWEETYDARTSAGALAAFLQDHAGEGSEVMIIEEDGNAYPVSASDDLDPDRTYIWVEEGKLMEYQGLDESTPGMVACPLCDGTGEVDEATAEEYAEAYGGGEGE